MLPSPVGWRHAGSYTLWHAMQAAGTGGGLPCPVVCCAGRTFTLSASHMTPKHAPAAGTACGQHPSTASASSIHSQECLQLTAIAALVAAMLAGGVLGGAAAGRSCSRGDAGLELLGLLLPACVVAWRAEVSSC